MEFTNCRATNVVWISIISGFVLKYGTLKITCFIIIVRISIITSLIFLGVQPIFRHIHKYIYILLVNFISYTLKLPQISDDINHQLWLLKYQFVDTPSLSMTHHDSSWLIIRATEVISSMSFNFSKEFFASFPPVASWIRQDIALSDIACGQGLDVAWNRKKLDLQDDFHIGWVFLEGLWVGAWNGAFTVPKIRNFFLQLLL